MFLSEFNLQILHKFDKSHIILNALSCLLNHNNTDECLNALDINVFNVYNDFIMTMLKDFSNCVQKTYKKNTIWALILKMLHKSDEKSDINFAF